MKSAKNELKGLEAHATAHAEGLCYPLIVLVRLSLFITELLTHPTDWLQRFELSGSKVTKGRISIGCYACSPN